MNLSECKTENDILAWVDQAPIEELLKFDGIYEASRIIGKSYKDSLYVENFGFSLTAMASQRKRTLLTEVHDTKLMNELPYYLDVIAKLGFTELARFAFDSRPYNNESPVHKETFFMFIHEEKGILLAFDTYNETNVNGGKFYYNWKPNNIKEGYTCTSSGGYKKVGDDLIWAGDHDCREAIVFNITNLEKNGTFIKPWVEKPFLWLVGYNEYDNNAGYPYTEVEKITEERYKLLPEWAPK